MKLTVVTPSYNQGKYIKRTIDSVLSQNIQDMEYIVMDGGSSDGTVDILKTYSDRIIWRSETDKGQTDAVNKGIRLATGDIIGWLNSDDIYFPGAVQKVLKVFEEKPEVNVVYGNAWHIAEDDSYIEDYYTEEFDYERLKDVCFICQPSLFFRKKLVDEYGYLDDTLTYCMDYEYWLRLGKKEHFYYLPELIAGSRLYNDNKTIGSRKKVHEEMIRMQKKVLGRVQPRWIYNLAHVEADERNIPREIDGRVNPEFARTLVRTSIREFIKNYHYIPLSELGQLREWSRLSRNN